MVPRCAIQVTDLFVVLPWMLEENWSVPSVVTEVEAGETAMEATGGFELGAEIVIVAEADLVVSATLVAVMVAEPAAAGAV
jgi:hypothetical protein